MQATRKSWLQVADSRKGDQDATYNVKILDISRRTAEVLPFLNQRVKLDHKKNKEVSNTELIEQKGRKQKVALTVKVWD